MKFDSEALASPAADAVVSSGRVDPGSSARGRPAVAASDRLGDVVKLTKLRIATLSTLSAATGFVVFSRTLNSGVLTACLGVLLVAMGACAMNQFQDRDFDARMNRTRGRPIPTGAIKPGTALVIAILLVSAGSLILWRAHALSVALIALTAVVLYNAIYTYFKRVWAFAAFPGSLIGALPPVIGWAAAGGGPFDARALALAFFFLVWQIPHFWLLLSMYGGDYERAGLPSLTKVLSGRQLAGLTFLWMLAASASSLLLAVFGLTRSPWIDLGLLACGLWLAWKASRLLGACCEPRLFRQAFRSINIYALLVMSLLIGDALM